MVALWVYPVGDVERLVELLCGCLKEDRCILDKLPIYAVRMKRIKYISICRLISVRSLRWDVRTVLVECGSSDNIQDQLKLDSKSHDS